jgi:glycosyltransferase involved in cell wall biosynthesis
VRFRWLVAGDGPELDAIRAAVSAHGLGDAVELLGPVSSDRVRELLHTADLALLPCVVAADGERDGIPIFLCEAVSLGVPVVTTPVSGNPEFFRDGATAFLAQPGDADSLARTLERALRDPAAARAIGERARAETRPMLDVRSSARQLLVEIGHSGPPSPP